MTTHLLPSSLLTRRPGFVLDDLAQVFLHRLEPLPTYLNDLSKECKSRRVVLVQIWVFGYAEKEGEEGSFCGR